MRMMGRLSSKRYRIYYEVFSFCEARRISFGSADTTWDGTSAGLDKISEGVIAEVEKSLPPSHWAYGAPMHVQIGSVIELWGEVS